MDPKETVPSNPENTDDRANRPLQIRAGATSSRPLTPQVLDESTRSPRSRTPARASVIQDREAYPLPVPDGDSMKEQPSAPTKPTLERSWDVIMEQVNLQDEGLVRGWKEDIDTLLVFAGLFSAVVTAFTIESYQWLSEAPEDTAVALLTTISHRLEGQTTAPPEPFKATTSDIRINALWFLSLILALVDALFCLLCKQWLREHRSPTHTRTPLEALALRWLRHESFERWHASTVLAALPVLLELALFLFLAGLLELLWTRHAIPFAIAMVIIGFAVLFYLGTTIIPSIDIVRQVFQINPTFLTYEGYISSAPARTIMNMPSVQLVCPYKSPQAWAAFKAFRTISRLPGCTRIASSLLRRKFPGFSGANETTEKALNTMGFYSNWSSFDLHIIQRSQTDLIPPFYELKGLRWLVRELRDSPFMVPHLQNVLEMVPAHLVMPAVFDAWLFRPDREWDSGDIEAALGSDDTYWRLKVGETTYQSNFLAEHNPKRSVLFDQMLHCNHLLINWTKLWRLDKILVQEALHALWNQLHEGKNDLVGFPIPFHRIRHILENSETMDDGVQLLEGCERASREIWKREYVIRSEYETHLSWLQALAEHIIGCSPQFSARSPETTTSIFVGSAAGRAFLEGMHHFLISEGVFNALSEITADPWLEAIDIVRRVHDLPENHFALIAGYFPMSVWKLRKLLSGGLEHDFRYLDSYKRHWDSALSYQKLLLLQILSDHINSASEPIETHTTPSGTKPSLLVMSPEGLEFFAFVNDKVTADPWFLMWPQTIEVWVQALECVRVARELPPDYFAPTPVPVVNTVHPNETPLDTDHTIQKSVCERGEVRSETPRSEPTAQPNGAPAEALIRWQGQRQIAFLTNQLEVGDSQSHSKDNSTREEPGRGVDHHDPVGGSNADKNV